MADNLTLRIEVQDDGSAVIKDFSGNVKKFATDVESTGGKTESAFSRMNSAVTNFSSSAGFQLGAAGVLGAITGMVVKSVQTFAEWESAMLDVQDAADLTASEATRLGDSLRAMSTDAMQGAVSAQDLASIAADAAGRLNLSASKDITAFTQTVAEIALTTNLTKEQAAANMADIEKTFKASLEANGQTAAEQSAQIASAINEVSSDATVQPIMELVNKLGAAGQALGLSVADVTGISAAMVNAGVDVQSGGNTIREFMLALAQDSSTFAEAFGLNAAKLATALKTDPIAAMNMVTEAMGQMAATEGPGALSATLEDLGMGGGRAQEVFLRLKDASGQMDAEVRKANEGFQQGTSLHQEAAVAAQTTANQFAALKNASVEMALSLGQELAPATKLVLTGANEMVSGITSALAQWNTVTAQQAANGATSIKTEFFDAIVAQATGFGDALTGAVAGFKDTLVKPFVDAKAEITGAFDEIKQAVTGNPLELKMDAASALETLKQLQANNVQLLSQTPELQEKFRAVFYGMRDAMAANREPGDRLKEQFVELQNELLTVGEISHGNSVFPDMAQAILDAQGKATGLTGEMGTMQTQVSALGAAYDATRAQMTEQENAIKAVNSQMAALQTQVSHTYGFERDRVEASIKALAAKKAALQDEFQATRTLAETQKDAFNTAKSGIKDVEGEHKRLSSEIKQNERDLKAWADAYAMSLSKASGFDKAAASLKQTTAAMKEMGGVTDKTAQAYANSLIAAGNFNAEAQETQRRMDAINSTIGQFSGLADTFGSLGSNIGAFGEMFNIDTGGLTDLLGKVQGFAQLPSMLSSTVGGVKSVFGGLSGLLGGGGLGGLGGLFSSITGSLGGLGGALSSVLPALGPIGLAGGAIFAAWKLLPKLFAEAKSEGKLAAESMQDFVAQEISGGAELSAALQANYTAFSKSGNDFQTFLQTTGTTMDATFGGISANWQQGSTALDLFTQSLVSAGVPMDKAPQQALMMMASFQDMGLSAEQAGQKMLEIAKASGMSEAEIRKLEAALTSVSGTANAAGAATAAGIDPVAPAAQNAAAQVGTLGTALDAAKNKLSGTGEEGAATTNVFDGATSSVTNLNANTNTLAGSLGQVTGMLAGTGAQGAATNNVFVQSDQAVTSLNANTGTLAANLSSVTSQMLQSGAAFTDGSAKSQTLNTNFTDFGKTAGEVGQKVEAIDQAVRNIPTSKMVTIYVKTEGGVPQMADGGEIGRAGLAIFNERGMEAARFPGGQMALLTTPGPVLGAFPVGTQIIPHTQVPALLNAHPHIPRMAQGGTVDGFIGGVTVNIQNLVVQGQLGNPNDMRRLADELSREIGARLNAKQRRI